MYRKALLGAAALACLMGGTAVYAQSEKTVVTVVKVTGENWFRRMDEGVKEFDTNTPGINATQTGPAKADAAQQQRLIEDLVARKVDAIAVVPMDPSALEGVFRRAASRGIKVITHEADTSKDTLADIEAFDNTVFGARMNERIAKCMNGSGKWTTFVGSLGSLTHVQWAKGGEENAKKYPDMKLVDPFNESFNDANNAYQKAKELLRKHPDLKGFQGGSAIDVIGIGRAVEEAGLSDKTCVVGIGLPKDTGPYLESGAVDGISLWDPKDAGIVMNKVAQMILDGTAITDGMNLGVKGYEKVGVKKGPGEGIIITGEAWLDVDKANYKDYPF